MTIRYIGLDFESSGSDPWGKHVPIQIGMAVHGSGRVDQEPSDDRTFESLIGGWGTFGAQTSQYEWSEEAYKVHGIEKEAVYAAPPVWAVDIQAAAWLLNLYGHGNRMWNITVGWNVAGFDRQFITRWFPNLNKLLSYRTVDLNALVFARAKTEVEYNKLKGQAKAYADKFNPAGKRHDALVDAKAALHERLFLTVNE